MQKIIVITGPTAVGKTKLSIAMAKLYDGEIINADSMQVYKGLNIGTAKITDKEKENIPHHLLDIREVTDNYSVYDYQRDGRKIIADIISRGKTPIIVGGTGLYIKALLYDYKFNCENLSNDFKNLSNEEIYRKIKEDNPDVNIRVNNRRRTVRLLNKYQSNNKESNNGDKLLFDAIFIGLTTDRSDLYDRINNRVDKMISNGLVEEVKQLYLNGINSKAVMTGIGYKELYLYFNGELSFEQTIELIKKNSRNYAKRQYTWFNNKMNIKWFNVDFGNFNKTINMVIEYIKKVP